MKRFFLIFVGLLVLPLSVFAEDIENVSRMDITLHFPYGAREGVYTGSLQNGVANGYGCFETENAKGDPWTYVGEFKDGMFCGEGYQFWLGSTETDIGVFENGLLTSGQLINRIGGYTFSGTFTDEENITGEGKVYDWNDVLIFEGTFENGVFQTGTLYNEDGTVAATGTFGQGFTTFIRDNAVNGYVYH